MDIHDDPSTTTTTDYDSGDSAGVDYVYEQQKDAERKVIKGGPLKNTPSKRNHRGVTRCNRGPRRAEGDAEITVIDNTDTEAEEDKHRLPPRTRPPQLEAESMSSCDIKNNHCHNKAGRGHAPYIEEYPEDAPRPAILLKEHRITGRPSTLFPSRVKDSEHLSSSTSSGGRSPVEKRLPPRPSRRRSRDSPRHCRHHKRRSNSPGTYEDEPSDSDLPSSKPSPGNRVSAQRRRHHEPGPELASVVSRSSSPAGDLDSQPDLQYSSSWPVHLGSHQTRRRLGRRDQEYDTDEDIEEENMSSDNTNGAHHGPTRSRVLSFRGRAPEREREPPRQETLPLQIRRRHEHEHRVSPPLRPRPSTVVSQSRTLNQGHRSVATSLCEVWRGVADDWESPYQSASDDGFNPDAGEEPITLLRTVDLPPRRSSPRLLPPRRHRRDVGFHATSSSPHPYSYPPSSYADQRPRGYPSIHPNQF
ncbi:hypothetical protein N658DRAFT_325994 [Parathielavia hyrcaniae]|uniref:Uncharacterized protein n=1 Tax=Parathielavia hyrcaniae TaxID=113614 RepID=A0AAN6Q6U1_9PEZI|nr:hypothetical protein N658DRAFT_325994 [Parathielavia hyrcaniae]